ncbi:hypothetical cytosolic protein [Coxiella burnetii CbuK_Q154]|uniref:Hypothetical cytosolic protein n=2 Tax=Coxiella burnetii TaxID=777 RepID=Q83AJ1_COXBU|nr:DUF1658 domain-containing protein [Coxiella burnetii]NP_820871.1 hypothetical protein CBU_1894 [Coxiella burnetii RSA 493]ACI23058.1 hypothetical cytosolic protein [Coxiella burnetii Dugway 5J108-111]ACJ17708.1 hypothetical cytosolic protein [Coxiella burnetii CbuG_Q212]ACJ19509.1 hypothetical cytosolic protein [Coxiella burnetii CbuK_Q154]AAO91385.1 hypothetical cytosolic protein [Coxiella burnetii RSA 493]BBL36167.1 hypothetical cytosolic protein [Coxiella burnetii]
MFFKPLLAGIPVTSAVKALDSLSIDRRPTHGNDGHFSNYLIPSLPHSLKLTPMRLRGDDGL